MFHPFLYILSVSLFLNLQPQDTTVSGGVLKESSVKGLRSAASAYAGDRVAADELRRATDLSDAVRVFGGLQVKDYGGVGGLKTVNIRSLGSEFTGVFIDGIQVSNAQNMQVDLGRFGADEFSSAALSYGEGSNSVGAAVPGAREEAGGNNLMLTSGEPRFFPGRKDTWSVRLRGGSFGTVSPSMAWNHRAGNLTSRLSAEWIKTDGRYRFHDTGAGYDTTMVRENSDLQSFRASWRLSGKSGNNSWRTLAHFYDSERGLPGPVVRRASAAITTKDRQRDRDIFVQWSGEHRFSNSSIIGAKARYSYAYTNYRTNPYEDPAAMPVDNRFALSTAYLSLSHVFTPVQWWKGTLAADYEFSYLHSNQRSFVFPRRHSIFLLWGNSFYFKNLQIDLKLPAQFAFDKLGAEGPAGFPSVEKDRSAFTPSISAIWLPSRLKHLTFNGFIRRSFRMPSFNDLYYTFVGNSSLKPENAMQYDLGFRHGFEPVRGLESEFKADFYYNMVTDKIIAVPTANQFRWTMYNIGRVHVQGMDLKWSLNWDKKAQDALKASLTMRYSFQRSRDFSTPGSVTWKGQIPYIPMHSGSATGTVGWKDWDLSLNYVASSTRWSSSANIPDYRTAPFQTLDAWISRTFKEKGSAGRPGELTLRLALRNLMDEKYEVVQGYPMPGFNLLATIEYSF
ncbi:MAG: TonB-dependent receptor plug domain-containing protein [Bacteroidales bacterium]|nr:TonB-dependent receptor plug domain-containing protein [Bacteroidales bacterium]